MPIIKKTQRWNWLRSEKYIIDYTTFQPSTLQVLAVPLAMLVQGGLIVFAEMRPTITWLGLGITKVTLFLTSEYQGSPPLIVEGDICNVTGDVVINPTTGHAYATPPRHLHSGSTDIELAFRKDIATQLYIGIRVEGTGRINALTQGEIELWYTWHRNV